MRENAIGPPYSILLSMLRHKSFFVAVSLHRVTVVTGYFPLAVWANGTPGGKGRGSPSARAIEPLKTVMLKTQIVASRAILRKFFFTGHSFLSKG
jgi:hypothetical protein